MKMLDATGLILLITLTLGAAGCAPSPSDQTTANSVPINAASSTTAAPAPSGATTSTTQSAATTTTIAATETPRTPDAATPATPAAVTANWSQWRGPNRDGNVIGFPAPPSWPKSLKDEWKVTVGVGHSSPVVSEGKIYVFARQGEEEVLLCLDAVTGKELWRSGQTIAYEMHPAARGHGKGPKSTPVVGDGKVFTLGITGILSAHDAKTGKLIWRKDFSKQYPTTSPLYGTAMSPVVEKNL
ncbi:MAG TPA: PQQ-binding-like beta-propeller repeat protein, partial [Pyrinomonadaceae bacterium]|nr:PQQ-binding-like beta-propeller repeat protein [Pyrinomonadaceae bacterium]